MLNSVATLALTFALQSAPASPAPLPLPDDRPIVDIFQNLGHDLKRLPSLDSVAILGGGAIAAAIGHNNDAPLSNWVAKRDPAGYTSTGRVFGDGWIQGGGALATYGIGLLTHDRMTIHIGSDLIRAQTLNAILTRSMKSIVGRRRPGGGPDSMPSGHTTATFASAAVLNDHFGWKVGVPSFAVASFVGWTRVRDHAHWLTDVIVGASIGTAVGHTVAAGHRGRSWAVIPVASSKSVAVYYVRKNGN
ncbi:MAG: phosphatase PAP2 family protein [Acidobacteriota bacterium]